MMIKPATLLVALNIVENTPVGQVKYLPNCSFYAEVVILFFERSVFYLASCRLLDTWLTIRITTPLQL